jgi:AbrB family looped-hinge helix DNA binding protein
MPRKTTIDRAGRVVLPKALRDSLQLEPGDWLSLEGSENEIVIRPVRGSVALQKKRGVWTFGSGEPLTLEQVNQTTGEVRRERDFDVFGSGASRPSPRAGKKAKSS